MLEIIKTPYSIGSQFVPAIVNDDWTSLDGSEDRQLERFLEDAQGSYFGHWYITENVDEFTRCEVSGLMGQCVVAEFVQVIQHNQEEN